MTSVALATEDELSEAVGVKLLSEHPVLAEVPPMLLRKGGSGYLRSRMNSWLQMADRQVVIILTDLDRLTYPLALLNDWLGIGRQAPSNLLLRIAEREIESWLLADHEALENLLGRKLRFPVEPDTLADPKQHLLGLAQRASTVVREDLVARQGAVAKQGLGYNSRMVDWVQTQWSPDRASARSPSLMRARRAIRETAHRVVQAQ